MCQNVDLLSTQRIRKVRKRKLFLERPPCTAVSWETYPPSFRKEGWRRKSKFSVQFAPLSPSPTL